MHLLNKQKKQQIQQIGEDHKQTTAPPPPKPGVDMHGQNRLSFTNLLWEIMQFLCMYLFIYLNTGIQS